MANKLCLTLTVETNIICMVDLLAGTGKCGRQNWLIMESSLSIKARMETTNIQDKLIAKSFIDWLRENQAIQSWHKNTPLILPKARKSAVLLIWLIILTLIFQVMTMPQESFKTHYKLTQAHILKQMRIKFQLKKSRRSMITLQWTLLSQETCMQH